MEISEVIDTFGPLPGIAGLFALLVWYMRRSLSGAATEELSRLNDSERSFRNDLMERLKEVEAQLREVEDKNRELERELLNVRHMLSVLESAHEDLPFPGWVKDKDLRMRRLNREYGRQVLAPMGLSIADYLGKLDHEVMPEPIAAEWNTNDRWVWETGHLWIGIEQVPDGQGSHRDWIIIKYVYYVANVKFGIAGMAFPKNIAEIQLADTGERALN